MDEADIRIEAAIAFEGLRKSKTATGGELQSVQIASLAAAEKLATQALVDLNRIATALDTLALPRAGKSSP